MKKTLLSAAAFAVVAVSAVSIAPTTSEAIPAFARQTGAACLSCHFQTFPAINSFGRSFKIGALTDVGEQALIEDDNLSLPAVLNSSFVLRAQYQNVSNNNGSSTTTWAIPADAVLLMAGRVGSNTGAFIEFDGTAANWQLMNSFDFDSFKGGLNIQNTGFGPTAAIELSNVFGQHSGKLAGGNVSSVANIIGDASKAAYGKQTTSVAAWAGSESFIVQLAAVAFTDASAVTNASFIPMIRGDYIMDLGGAEVMIGGGILSGTQRAAVAATKNAAGTVIVAASQLDVGVDAKFIDVQVQGEMGDMSYGVYADWTTTKSKSVTGGSSNIFDGGLASAAGTANGDVDVDGYSIRVEVSPVHKLMLGAGIGQVKATPNVGTGDVKVTTTLLSATYEVYQNMEINTYYQIDRQTDTVNNTASTTTKTLFAEVEALF